jgi:hypothetical protein
MSLLHMSDDLPAAWRSLARTREHDDLDRAAFEQTIVPQNRPVIMRGLAADWDMVRAGTKGQRAFCAYLSAASTSKTAELWVGAPEAQGRFSYTQDLSATNFERKRATVAQICDLLIQCLSATAPPSLFAGAIYVPEAMPALVPHLLIPLLADEQERLTSLWIGNRSRTAAHYDRANNLACVVSGERRFLLFPTAQIANLYVGPIDHTPAGQAISLVDCEAPDFGRHPRFRDALAAAELAILQPGDVLYIPSLWWHYVASPSTLGAQINFWWIDGDAGRPGPTNALLLAMLALRDLPTHEREGWRALFEHYVFSGGADAAAGLPEAARGVLGKLDEAGRQPLLRHLGTELLKLG